MKKCFTVFIYLVSLTSFLFASNVDIKGRILNEKKEPIEFASIAMLQEKDSTLLFANITDSIGSYSFTNIPYGKYLIAVSAVGTSREYYGPLTIDSSVSSITIPDILLVQSKELNEVEIKAIKPLFVHKADMLIMDVEGSALRSTGTALDLLKKVPGVVVDNSNNIIFRGKQGVNITIDDKSTFLPNDQLVTYLQNMSANEVVRIEIVANPSAKFDAAGKGGYINIVTKKKVKQGLNGNSILWGGYGVKPKIGGGGGLSYGKNKINFYGRYYYGRRDNLSKLNLYRKILYADTLTLFDQESDVNELNISHDTRAGLDYFPDSLTSIGLVLNGRIMDKSHNNLSTTNIRIGKLDSIQSLRQKNTMDGLDSKISSGIYYKRILDTMGGEFSVNADLLIYRNSSHENFQTHYFNAQLSETGTPYFQRSKSATDITIGVGKIDYVHPLKKHDAKFETGVKSSYVETNNSLYFDVMSNQIWNNDTDRTNDFIYKEMINASYINGSFKWKKIDFQFGLRAEQTISDGNSPTLNKQIKNQYTQLFPNANISRRFGKNHNLNCSYSKRIDRPSYEALNPFIFYLDQYTFEIGNPFLKPQLTDAFSIDHSFMDAVFTSVAFSRTRDAMTVVTQQEDSTGIGYLTHVNLSTVDNTSFTLGFPIPIGKWFMAENSLTESYDSYRSNLLGTDINIKAWTFSVNSNFKFTLPKDFSIELSGSYNTKGRYGIFDGKERWQTDVGVTKKFLKNNLILTCTLNDIFYTGYYIATVNFQGQNLHINSKNENRSLWIQLRYTFGQTQQKQKGGYKSASEDLQKRANKK